MNLLVSNLTLFASSIMAGAATFSALYERKPFNIGDAMLISLWLLGFSIRLAMK